MNDATLVYSTFTGGKKLKPVHFGVSLKNERNGRIEIHFNDLVHVTGNSTDHSETMFHDSHSRGIVAAYGEANELTIRVVETLGKHTAHPFDEYLGVRLGASYIDDVYASCAVVYLRRNTLTDDLFADLGVAINGEYGAATVNKIDSYGNASWPEVQDTRAYNLLD